VTDDDYGYYYAALDHQEGEPWPDFDKARPPNGFYRHRSHAIAIWRKDGTCFAKETWFDDGKLVTRMHDREAEIGEGLFSYCAQRPITHEAYSAFLHEGRWPEEVEPSALSNLPADPAEALPLQLDDLIERANAYIRDIKQVTSQEQADKISNFGVLIADIEKRAETQRQEEKRPHLEAERQVDAKWRPLIDRAGMVKRNLKALLTSFLTAKRRRAEEEQRRVNESMGLPPDTAPSRAQPSQTTAGTVGRVSLRTRKVFVIIDLPAAAAFIAARQTPPEDFCDAVRAYAKMCNGAIPGIETKIEEYSA
jgi:hypothetical protein